MCDLILETILWAQCIFVDKGIYILNSYASKFSLKMETLILWP